MEVLKENSKDLELLGVVDMRVLQASISNFEPVSRNVGSVQGWGWYFTNYSAHFQLQVPCYILTKY